jgi:hypothetical protein
MSNPEATYEEMAQTATTLGMDITSQSIEERWEQYPFMTNL